MKRKLFTLLALSVGGWTHAQYCSGGPSSTADSNVGSVSLVGQSSNINYTGCPGVTGLEDQTSMVADLIAGTQYTIDVDWSTCGGNYGGAGSVWIDYNGNFTFEANEVIGDWSGTPSVSSSYTFTVPVNAVNGTQRLRVMQQEGGVLPLNPCGTYTWGSLTDFNVDISGSNGCYDPTDLTVTFGTTSSISLAWESSYTPTNGFTVEYGGVGFTPGTGTTTTGITTMSTTVTGLAADSLYEFYIYADCGAGASSAPLGPVQGNTYGQGHYLESNLDCGPGFTDIKSTGTQYQLGLNAAQGISLPFPIIHHGIEYTDASISQEGVVVLGTQNSNLLTYNTNILTQAGPELGFYVLWDDYEGATDPDDGIYTQVLGTAPNRTFIIQWEVEHDYYVSPNMNFQIQLNESTMDAYYLFDNTVTVPGNYTSNGGSATIGIVTDFAKEMPSYNNSNFLENNSCLHYYYTNCPKVENLTVTTYDYNQIGLSWNAGLSNESAWTIEYGPAGFAPGTGTTISVTQPHDTITGLTQLTDYDVYVYSECGTNNTGAGIIAQHQTAPLCANPFGIGANAAPDSIFASWNWNTNGSGLLPTSFNVAYVPSGQDLWSNGTIYNTTSPIFADTIVDTDLVASGVYDIYVQTECNTGDTSIYVGPINFLAFLDNDSSCYAQDLQVNDQTYILYNNGAQLDPGVQAIAPPAGNYNGTQAWGTSTIYKSTWYSFTAPASGDVMITGSDLNNNAKMAVYSTTDCGDYNQYTLEGANDNGVLFGSTSAAEWTVCGLTPGDTYYLLHSTDYSWTTGNFSIRLKELDFEAGTATGIVDACIGDTVDLFNAITGYELEYGSWIDLANTSQMVNGDEFATSVLASQVYDFEYRVQLGCSFDSIVGQVEIYPLSSAGQNGSIDVCLNQPLNLESGLIGNVDLGGDWFDPQDNLVDSDLPSAGSTPGQFNYDYIAGNGVCPDDTALVVVNVNPTCDYLGLEENMIQGIDVYPNPANDLLNIQSNGEHEALNVAILDVNGKIVLASSEELVTGNNISLNISTLAKGVYMVELYNNNVKNTYRVVVQ